MFWEEKIDRIKTQFSQDEFRVPFSDWSGIIKKLEARFVIGSKPAYQHTNWSEGLKKRVLLRKIGHQAILAAVSTLDPATNIWVIVELGVASMAQRLVYDCKPAALKQLVAIAPGDFYIGDKKYQWLSISISIKRKTQSRCSKQEISRLRSICSNSWSRGDSNETPYPPFNELSFISIFSRKRRKGFEIIGN